MRRKAGPPTGDTAADRQVRLCRLSTPAERNESGADPQHGLWLPATARNLEMLRWFMETGVSKDGLRSHWIEERPSIAVSHDSTLRH